MFKKSVIEHKRYYEKNGKITEIHGWQSLCDSVMEELGYEYISEEKLKELI